MKSKESELYIECENAITSGNVKKLKLLLEKNFNPNTKNSRYFSILGIACEYNNTEIISTLLDAGADINLSFYEGFTPLMWSIYHNKIDAAQYLLSRGADVNIKNWHGHTALSWVCCMKKMNDIAPLLVDAGADLNVIDNIGKTPLMVAEYNFNHIMVAYLKLLGAVINPNYIEKK